MKTVFPEKPAKDFNDWMNHIKREIDKNKKGKKLKKQINYGNF